MDDDAPPASLRGRDGCAIHAKARRGCWGGDHGTTAVVVVVIVVAIVINGQEASQDYGGP